MWIHISRQCKFYFVVRMLKQILIFSTILVVVYTADYTDKRQAMKHECYRLLHPTIDDLCSSKNSKAFKQTYKKNVMNLAEALADMDTENILYVDIHIEPLRSEVAKLEQYGLMYEDLRNRLTLVYKDVKCIIQAFGDQYGNLLGPVLPRCLAAGFLDILASPPYYPHVLQAVTAKLVLLEIKREVLVPEKDVRSMLKAVIDKYDIPINEYLYSSKFESLIGLMQNLLERRRNSLKLAVNAYAQALLTSLQENPSYHALCTSTGLHTEAGRISARIENVQASGIPLAVRVEYIPKMHYYSEGLNLDEASKLALQEFLKSEIPELIKVRNGFLRQAEDALQKAIEHIIDGFLDHARAQNLQDIPLVKSLKNSNVLKPRLLALRFHLEAAAKYLSSWSNQRIEDKIEVEAGKIVQAVQNDEICKTSFRLHPTSTPLFKEKIIEALRTLNSGININIWEELRKRPLPSHPPSIASSMKLGD